MNIKEILGHNIRKYRKLNHLTQEELAEKMNITQKHLSQLEIGNNFASAEIIEQLCKIFDIPPATLFFSSDLKLYDDSYLGKIDKLLKEEIDVFYKKIKERMRDV